MKKCHCEKWSLKKVAGHPQKTRGHPPGTRSRSEKRPHFAVQLFEILIFLKKYFFCSFLKKMKMCVFLVNLPNWGAGGFSWPYGRLEWDREAPAEDGGWPISGALGMGWSLQFGGLRNGLCRILKNLVFEIFYFGRTKIIFPIIFYVLRSQPPSPILYANCPTKAEAPLKLCFKK